MFSRVFVFLGIGIFSCSIASAQEIVVHGQFLKDTVKIGEQIPYSLSIRYPSTLSVVFPDSAFAFTPFEFQRKNYFPTHTKNKISVDSAIYLLSTFEIDSLQSLALPVFVVHRRDCTTLYSQRDTVVLKHLVGSIPESVAAKDLPLKSNADYLNVRWLLNYPLLLIIVGVLVVILIIVWLVFGKRIRKYFKLKRLNRKHLDFLRRFAQNLELMQKEGNSSLAENTLVIWKKYMEGLGTRPYTKLTTKEIRQLVLDEKLDSALHHIDRMVYARDGMAHLEAFDELRSFTQTQFTQKTEEVKHG